MNERLPLLRHRLSAPSAFRPEALVEVVRVERALATARVPSICVLDFDGDLTDRLISAGIARLYPAWACFHTKMYSFEIDGMECGIIARTIGGPYAVLVAEQLFVSGAQIQLGLTSAGRVNSSLPVPSLVVATSAIRDEGTSFHYVPPAETVAADLDLANCLYEGLQELDLPFCRGGFGRQTRRIAKRWRRSMKTQQEERWQSICKRRLCSLSPRPAKRRWA
jgi:hypothetical protein